MRRVAVREKSVQEVADALGATAQAGRSGPADGSIPDYDSAVASETVSLDHLIEATRLSRKRSNEDERSRVLYGSYLPKLMDAYRKAHGEIEESFVAQNIDAGAVLLRTKTFATPRRTSRWSLPSSRRSCGAVALSRGRASSCCAAPTLAWSCA
jgi:hypothetical protein